MKKLILFILLLPSLCFAGPEDSFIMFDGVNDYGQIEDNATMEPGRDDWIVAVRMVYKSAPAVNGDLLRKWNISPNRGLELYIPPTGSLAMVMSDDGINATSFGSAVGVLFPHPTNKRTVVYRYEGALAGSSGWAGIWLDGIMKQSASMFGGLFDSTAHWHLSGTDCSEADIYEVAYIIGADLSGVTGTHFTEWHNNPGVPSWMTGASRYFYWGPDGAKQWPSGKWAETGVSTGKTPGQFDMSLINRPSYVLWKPTSLWAWAKGLWESRRNVGVAP